LESSYTPYQAHSL